MENFHSILNAHKARHQQAMNSRICFHIFPFLFSAIYNRSPDKTKVSDYSYKFTQILSDYLRISCMS